MTVFTHGVAYTVPTEVIDIITAELTKRNLSFNIENLKRYHYQESIAEYVYSNNVTKATIDENAVTAKATIATINENAVTATDKPFTVVILTKVTMVIDKSTKTTDKNISTFAALHHTYFKETTEFTEAISNNYAVIITETVINQFIFNSYLYRFYTDANVRFAIVAVSDFPCLNSLPHKQAIELQQNVNAANVTAKRYVDDVANAANVTAKRYVDDVANAANVTAKRYVDDVANAEISADYDTPTSITSYIINLFNPTDIPEVLPGFSPFNTTNNIIIMYAKRLKLGKVDFNVKIYDVDIEDTAESLQKQYTEDLDIYGERLQENYTISFYNVTAFKRLSRFVLIRVRRGYKIFDTKTLHISFLKTDEDRLVRINGASIVLYNAHTISLLKNNIWATCDKRYKDYKFMLYETILSINTAHKGNFIVTTNNNTYKLETTGISSYNFKKLHDVNAKQQPAVTTTVTAANKTIAANIYANSDNSDCN